MSFAASITPYWFITSITTNGINQTPTSIVNNNIDVTIYPEWYRQITLEWKIPDTWLGAKFHVYYWPGGDEEYIRLTSTLIDSQVFSDTTTRDYSKTQQGFYIVEAHLPFTTEIIRSYPVQTEYKRRDKLEKFANEVQRREFLLLSKFAGVKSFFFRKKVRGLRCSRCWDPVNEKTMDDHCSVCYGTSFEGGYFDPVPVYVQYDPSQSNKIKTFQGIIEPNSIGAWTISLPQMTSDDVLIRTGDWSAYKIINVSNTEIQSKPVKQVLGLTQLSKDDIENELISRTQSITSTEYLAGFQTDYNKQRFPRNLIDNNINNDPKWAVDQDLQSLPIYTI
jgi:hypothetical protein